MVLFVVSCSEPIKQESHDTKSEKETSAFIPYDFDESKVGLSNATDVANGVIEFLKNADTTQYLNLAIPLQVQKYLFQQNFAFRLDIKDTSAFMDSLESRFDERMKNFLVRSFYIHQIMVKDKQFDIKEATIDSIFWIQQG